VLTMTPKSITADGEIAPKVHRYIVRFDHNGKDVDFTFILNEERVNGVHAADDEFWKITCEDPLVPALMQTILRFHEARLTELVPPADVTN
jgi:hypothetical protein